jgi:hypothetical protein
MAVPLAIFVGMAADVGAGVSVGAAVGVAVVVPGDLIRPNTSVFVSVEAAAREALSIGDALRFKQFTTL